MSLLRLISLFRSASVTQAAVARGKATLQTAEDSLRTAQAMAVEKDQLRAAKGERQAHYDLGERYYEGRGVRQDYAKAAESFQKAAMAGHPKAQTNLGMIYFLGRGISRDKAEGCKWLTVAAQQGDPEAKKARIAAKERMTSEELLEGRRRAEVYHRDLITKQLE